MLTSVMAFITTTEKQTLLQVLNMRRLLNDSFFMACEIFLKRKSTLAGCLLIAAHALWHPQAGTHTLKPHTHRLTQALLHECAQLKYTGENAVLAVQS